MSNFHTWLQYVNDYWKNSFRDRKYAELMHYSSKYLQLQQSNENELKTYFETYTREILLIQASISARFLLMIEFLFFIPGMICIPIIRTVYDGFTRPHYKDSEIKQLKAKLDSEPHKFEAMIQEIIKNCYSYTSYNSRALSSDLKFIVYKHLFLMHLNTLDMKQKENLPHATIYWFLDLSRKYNAIDDWTDSHITSLLQTVEDNPELALKRYNCSLFWALNIIKSNPIQELIRTEQQIAIQEYLDVPENNGSKLMQSLFSI